MEREYRFSPETIKEMRDKNYNLITDMAAKLNTLKGYEAGYGNPQKGKMIVNYKGQNYLIDIEPISTMGDSDLHNVMEEYSFIFNDR